MRNKTGYESVNKPRNRISINKIIGSAAAGLLLSCSLLPLAAVAGPICERVGDKQFDACQLQVRSDSDLSKAACINLGDAMTRTDCRADADTTRQEEMATCREVRESRKDSCDLLGENRYHPDPLLDPAITFIHPDDIPSTVAPNPWLNLTAGITSVIRTGDEGEELVIIHVTDEVREIQGVACRVVIDAVFEETFDEEDADVRNGDSVDYEPVEVTDDWFGQDSNGNVYYCGERSRDFEDELIFTLEGSFESGVDGAKAGILLKAMPEVGDAHRQEFAPSEAEDVVEYLDLAGIPFEAGGGENERFPCAPAGCLQTHDSNPQDPGSTEFKYYRAGTGLVLAIALDDGEPNGEREELLCIGDSLDVLSDPDCEIASLPELMEDLCDFTSGALCP